MEILKYNYAQQCGIIIALDLIFFV